MIVDFFVSQRHYADHLRPIVEVAEERGWLGDLWTSRASIPFGRRITARSPAKASRPIVVAGAADAKRFAHRPVIYLEHGAGQTYLGDNNAVPEWGWPGARNLDHVVLFLVPGPAAAAAWRSAYPSTPVAAVGCPKLDEWVGAPVPLLPYPRVALTFHWDCELLPETRSAAPHYLPHIADLIEWSLGRVTLLGHGHPRAYGKLAKTWRTFHVERHAEQRSIFEQASVLVGDNTSALYEFAALGRPVVVLNAPWYRRNVHHGLRFWDAIPGEQVDDPRWLPHAIERAIQHPEATAEHRQHATAQVYAAVDGRAAERAATAIEEVCGG